MLRDRVLQLPPLAVSLTSTGAMDGVRGDGSLLTYRLLSSCVRIRNGRVRAGNKPKTPASLNPRPKRVHANPPTLLPWPCHDVPSYAHTQVTNSHIAR